MGTSFSQSVQLLYYKKKSENFINSINFNKLTTENFTNLPLLTSLDSTSLNNQKVDWENRLNYLESFLKIGSDNSMSIVRPDIHGNVNGSKNINLSTLVTPNFNFLDKSFEGSFLNTSYPSGSVTLYTIDRGIYSFACGLVMANMVSISTTQSYFGSAFFSYSGASWNNSTNAQGVQIYPIAYGYPQNGFLYPNTIQGLQFVPQGTSPGINLLLANVSDPSTVYYSIYFFILQ